MTNPQVTMNQLNMSKSINSDEMQSMALVTSMICLIGGGCGLLINYVWPGSTTIDGLMVVGGIYLLQGLLSRVASK